ncbi:serine hydrolase [Pyxidicoccus fallax]|uniref:Serine hydrolase n=1 Tax=Pyxidicoccus fallax TaxID=394095 RepID=A0A848LIE4_9BACT|nr:serine hydrolase [Pyxidicoccus fallax]NMO17493.1 serine hydrolase [Pyxidicoccus fallax]NPC79620.1 serine hydrolase [Pyxidicoccus fallax]
MRQPLLRFTVIAFVGCVGLALPAAAESRKPVTQWVARPSESARVARVEAGLAPAAIPGEEPVRLSLQEWMELYRIPGLSIAVFDKHALVWAKGHGVKQAGGTEPVTVDTLFQAASISKPVTALAALRYVEEGKWTLDSNINDKLVSWKLPDNTFTKEQKVTLRRLLSHTAGTTVHGFPGYGVNAPRPTTQQVLDGVKPANTDSVRVDLVPGSEVRYSGGGFTIVQSMMTDQLQKPFPRIMREAVLAPLGMKDSTFEQPLPEALASRAATATHASGKSVDGRWHVYPEMAAAGLWTTPSDLARFAIEVSRLKAGKAKGVLSPGMAKQMLTKQADGFGLGFQLEEGSDRFGHGGVNEGFTSTLIAFADSGSGVVMMANGDNGPLLFERVAASIAAEYGWKSFHHRLDSPLMAVDLLVRRKGADAALSFIQAMRSRNPERGLPPQLLNSLGYGQLIAGNLEDAVTLLKANVEFFPDDANAHDSLGEAYFKAGRTQEAIASYKKSLELDPKNTHAVEMLQKLGASR